MLYKHACGRLEHLPSAPLSKAQKLQVQKLLPDANFVAGKLTGASVGNLSVLWRQHVVDDRSADFVAAANLHACLMLPVHKMRCLCHQVIAICGRLLAQSPLIFRFVLAWRSDP